LIFFEFKYHHNSIYYKKLDLNNFLKKRLCVGLKLWKKGRYDFRTSVEETMGCLHRMGAIESSHLSQYLIKKYNLSSIDQVADVKKQLLRGNILIINVSTILGDQNVSIVDFKRSIDQIRAEINLTGGSIGRIGDTYLIITPNSHIKISH